MTQNQLLFLFVDDKEAFSTSMRKCLSVQDFLTRLKEIDADYG